MGYEVAGVVEAIGEGVEPGLIGKPVVAMTRFGGQSEKVVVPAGQLFLDRTRLVLNKRQRFPVNYFHGVRAAGSNGKFAKR